MNIAELMESVGPSEIQFQWLAQCMSGTISTTKDGVKLTITTNAVTVHDLAFGTGKVGMIVWLPREKFDAVVSHSSTGQGRTGNTFPGTGQA